MEAGLEVKSTVTVLRRRSRLAPELSDDAVAKVPLDTSPQRQLLQLISPDGKYNVLHDRQWHTYWDDPKLVVLKRLEKGQVIAQCNLTAGPPAGKGKHQDVNQFRDDVRRSLGQRFVQFLGAGEVDGDPAGGLPLQARRPGAGGRPRRPLVLLPPRQSRGRPGAGHVHARRGGRQGVRRPGPGDHRLAPVDAPEHREESVKAIAVPSPLTLRWVPQTGQAATSALEKQPSGRWTCRTVLLPGYGLMREVDAGRSPSLWRADASHLEQGDGLGSCQVMNTRLVPGRWSLVTQSPLRQELEPGVETGAGTSGLVLRRSRSEAQVPDAKAGAPPVDPEALSARYRFIETYAATEDPAKPELLNQYQVACRVTVKEPGRRPRGLPSTTRGAPDDLHGARGEDREGKARDDVVRRYDRANFRSTVDVRPLKTRLLEGLTILYRLQICPMPLVQ